VGVRTLNCPLFESVPEFQILQDLNANKYPTFLLLILPGLQSVWFFAFLGADLKLSAFSKSADGNHTILAAPIAHPRLQKIINVYEGI
jgi:hypothetical protein